MRERFILFQSNKLCAWIKNATLTVALVFTYYYYAFFNASSCLESLEIFLLAVLA